MVGYYTPENPLNALAQAQRIGANRQDMKMRGMEMQQAQDDQSRMQNMNALFRQTGGNPQAMEQALTEQGDMQGVMQLRKMNPQANPKDQLEMHLMRLNANGQIMSGVKDQASWDAAKPQLAQIWGQDAVQHMPEQYDPALVEQNIKMGQSTKDQLSAQREDRMANFQQQQLAQGNRRLDLLEQNSAGTPSNSISPEAIDNAAARYNTDGTIPSLGMGKGAARIRGQILTRAAELNSGIDGSQQRGDQLVRKTQGQALGQLQKQYTMVSAFEKNAQKNATLALQLADKADNTGSPIINKWIQAGQKSITGSPEVNAFNAANETFVNEYAKIMSGSMGNTPVSDAARAHAHEMLSTIQAPEDYKAVLAVLRQEMNNRITGLQEELAASKAGMYTQKQPAQQQAPSGLSPEANSFFGGQ